MRRELFLKGIPFKYEWPLPLEYKGIRLECGYGVDIVVDSRVAVEVKSVEALASIHDAQVLTYLRLGGWRLIEIVALVRIAEIREIPGHQLAVGNDFGRRQSRQTRIR